MLMLWCTGLKCWYGETKAGDLYIQYGKFFNLMHE